MKETILITVSLILVSNTLAKELLVRREYTTIQAAIDAASNGDTVIVEPNIYCGDINFKGKAITVRSSNPDNWKTVESTIIYGLGMGRSCVVFNQGESSNSVLEGFTLSGGTGTHIGYTNYNGQIKEYAGGGILCKDSSPTIRKCNIIYNGTMTHYSSIRHPPAVFYGGGIALIGNCQATISNCVITYNMGNMGGGITIRSNKPEQATSKITNCTITNNEIDLQPPEYYEMDCWDTRPIITNTIIWSQNSRSLLIADPSLVTYSCVKQAYIFEGGPDPYDLTTMGGNISERPRFVQSTQTDYHLLQNSPCINTGDPNFTGDSKTDIDGQPRVIIGRIDIGADEFVPQIIVTKPSGSEVWTASSIHQITWSSYGAGTVDILFSKESGNNWQTVESNIPDADSYVWHLPDAVDSNQCMISVVPNTPDPNFICVKSGLFTIKPYSPRPTIKSTWKSLGGDFMRTGLSNSNGPELGCVKWQFTTDRPISASVTIGSGGRVHIPCEDGRLYTLDPNGSLLWSYDANSPLLSSPTIAIDGTVYVGSKNGKLYAIDVNGNLQWTCTTDGPISSSPAVSNDGNVFVCSQDGKLYALGQDGSELWSFKTKGPGKVPSGSIFASPAIGGDGTVYIAGLYDPNLYALDPNDGKLKWRCNFESGGWPFVSPVVAKDGTIYQTLLYDTNLYAIEPNKGTIIWSTNLADPCTDWFGSDYFDEYDADGWSEPALGPDGTIYVSLDDPYLRAVKPDGNIKWVTRLGTMGGFTLTISSDGFIYAASDDGHIYMVDPNGSQIGCFKTDRWLNFPVITADNTIIVGDSQDYSLLITDTKNTVLAIGQIPKDLSTDRNVNTVDFTRLASRVDQWLSED